MRGHHRSHPVPGAAIIHKPCHTGKAQTEDKEHFFHCDKFITERNELLTIHGNSDIGYTANITKLLSRLLSHLTMSDLVWSNSRSFRFRSLISRKGT